MEWSVLKVVCRSCCQWTDNVEAQQSTLNSANLHARSRCLRTHEHFCRSTVMLCCCSVSALKLLAGWQEAHPACKKCRTSATPDLRLPYQLEVLLRNTYEEPGQTWSNFVWLQVIDLKDSTLRDEMTRNVTRVFQTVFTRGPGTQRSFACVYRGLAMETKRCVCVCVCVLGRGAGGVGQLEPRGCYY